MPPNYLGTTDMLDEIELRARDFVRELALKSDKQWTDEHQNLERLVVELLMDQHRASINYSNRVSESLSALRYDEQARL